jgi:hypothetical protein
MIKSLSSDKPRRIGFYINSLNSLSEMIKVTQVQVRLICHEMEKSGFEDPYGMDKSQQEDLFVGIVTKYIRVPEHILREILS